MVGSRAHTELGRWELRSGDEAVMMWVLGQGDSSRSQRLAQLTGELREFKSETFDFTKTAIQLGIEYGLRLVGVVALLIIAWIVGRWARRTIYRILARPRMDETLVRFAANAARGLVLVLAVVGCLGIFGLDTTALAAVLGAVGVAVGLALQGSLSNIASGIMLLALRPFVVGDSIRVSGVEGRVDEIDLFTTKVDTADNRRVILPNSQVFGATIENLTHHMVRRVDVSVRTAYEADTSRTRDTLMQAARGIADRLPDREPEVTLTDLGPSGMAWQINVWTRTARLGAARDELVVTLKRDLESAGVGIMYPPQSVFGGQKGG